MVGEARGGGRGRWEPSTSKIDYEVHACKIHVMLFYDNLVVHDFLYIKSTMNALDLFFRYLVFREVPVYICQYLLND